MKFLLIILVVIKLCLSQNISPLEEYVFDDSDKQHFRYELKNIKNNGVFTTYTLNFTSLKWFDERISDTSIWWHDLYIHVPLNLKQCQPSLFFILSGENNVTNKNDQYLENIANLSTTCKCITVGMRQVPNQPIKFTDDPTASLKVEDSIIAWTIKLYNEKKSQYPSTYKNFPLLFPMTKSVKRGMDLVQAFCASARVSMPEKFITAGISKRGWTAYLISAVDRYRVVGVVPIVYDLVNFNKNLHKQYTALNGGFSFALADYYKVNLTRNVDTVDSYELYKLVDPKFYFEHYQKKKFLLILATNDEFMMTENTHAFFKDLSIQTESNAFIRRLADSNHFLTNQNHKIFSNINNFHYLITQSEVDKNNLMPKFFWNFANNQTHGVIVVSLSNLAAFDSFKISGLSAQTQDTNRKDFRQNFISPVTFQVVGRNITWESEILSSGQLTCNQQSSPIKLTYSIDRSMFTDGYTGFYVQVELKLKKYASAPNSDEINETFIISTETNIIPEYDPIGDCFDQECYGILV